MVPSNGPRLSEWKQLTSWAWLLAFTLLLFAFDSGHAQSGNDTAGTRIARDRLAIEEARRLHLNNGQVARLWAELASDEEDLGQFDQAEAAYVHALELFEREPKMQAAYAVTLNNLGTLYMLTGRGDASLNCRKRAFSIVKKLGDSLQIALAESHLADAYLALGKNKEAEQHALVAAHDLSSLPNATNESKASALVAYAFASCLSGHCREGVAAARQAVLFVREASPGNSFALGKVHVALGYAEWRTGEREKAETDLRDGIRMLRMELSPSHPLLLNALEIYRHYLAEDHREVEAQRIADEEKTTKHQEFAATIAR